MEPLTAATTFTAIIQVGDPLGTPEDRVLGQHIGTNHPKSIFNQ